MSVSPTVYLQRITAGQCGKCGRPTTPGKTLCLRHQGNNRASYARWKARQAARAGPNQLGCCGEMHIISQLPWRLGCCGKVIALPENNPEPPP